MSPQVEKIYKTAFDLIELRLNKKEQVHPFTVHAVAGDEKPVISMLDSGSNTLDLVKDLREKMKSLASKGSIDALAICYDMHISDPRNNKKTDAILIELASKKGGTRNIYIPYNFNDNEVIKKSLETSSEEVYF